MRFERLSCPKRLALLFDYLDEELSPEARAAVAAHRRSCLPCAEILASLTRTVRLLKAFRKESKPPASIDRAWKAAIGRRILSVPRASKKRR